MLLILLTVTTLIAIGLTYGTIRYSRWRNRTIILIGISALYFMIIFSIFAHYGSLFA